MMRFLGAAVGVLLCCFAVRDLWADGVAEPLSRKPVWFTALGGAVTLQGELLWLDRDDVPAMRPGVVLCHPDPRFGGSMDNEVVRALARGLAGAGMVVLRFNFRGVGRSQGSFGQGIAEVEDCRGAVFYLRTLPSVDPKRLGVVGYSFGAAVALRAKAIEPSAKVLVAVAFPLDRAQKDLGPYGFVRRAKGPLLFVSGAEDEVSSLESIRRLLRLTGVKAELRSIEAADHFFADGSGLANLCEVVSVYLCGHL